LHLKIKIHKEKFNLNTTDKIIFSNSEDLNFTETGVVWAETR
jgi:hypothetical protein